MDNTTKNILDRKAQAMYKSVQKNSAARCLMIVLSHLLIWAGVSVVSFYAWQYAWSYGTLVYVVSVIIVGTRYRAINNIVHECSHNTFAARRKDNETIGAYLCVLLCTSFSEYRATHTTHHVHTGHPEKDLDFKPIAQFGFSLPNTRARVWRHMLLPLSLCHVPSYIGRTLYEQRDPPAVKVFRSVYQLAIIAALLAYPLAPTVSLAVLGYIVIPYFTTYQIGTYWLDAVDHGGLLGEQYELKRTRNSVVDNYVMRCLLFPRGDCYHLLHHMYPYISVEALPYLHREAQALSPEYRELGHHLWHRCIAWLWPGRHKA